MPEGWAAALQSRRGQRGSHLAESVGPALPCPALKDSRHHLLKQNLNYPELGNKAKKGCHNIMLEHFIIGLAKDYLIIQVRVSQP